MKVSRKDLVGLFLALGIDTADEWDDAKLAARFEGGIRKYREGDAPLADASRETLFNDLVAAQEAGIVVEIVGDGGADEPPPERNGPAKKKADKPAAKKKADKPAAKKKADKPAAKKKADKPAAKKKADKPAVRKLPGGGAWSIESGKPRPFSDRGPGVARSIVAILQKAGDGRKDGEGIPVGLSKEAVHAKLVAAFPKRNADKLRTSVNNQIPTRLRRVRHIHAQRNPRTGGYFILGDGRAKPKHPARRGRPAAVSA